MSEKRRIVIKNSRKKSISRGNIAKRPKRTHTKPDRYGRRISASDRDAFFDQVSSNIDSDDTNQENVQTSESINLIESSDPGSSGSNSNSDEMVSIIDNSLTSPLETNDMQIPLHERNNEHAYLIEISDVEAPSNETNDWHSQAEGICSGNRHTTSLESNDHVILAKLEEIIKRISCIEKNSAKMEVRLRNIEQSLADNEVNKRESDGEAGFTQLGLPIKNRESLDKLEQDLNSEEFRKTVVNIEFFIGI